MLDHHPTVRPQRDRASPATGWRRLARRNADMARKAKTDGALPYGRVMAKAARILAALNARRLRRGARVIRFSLELLLDQRDVPLAPPPAHCQGRAAR